MTSEQRGGEVSFCKKSHVVAQKRIGCLRVVSVSRTAQSGVVQSRLSLRLKELLGGLRHDLPWLRSSHSAPLRPLSASQGVPSVHALCPLLQGLIAHRRRHGAERIPAMLRRGYRAAGMRGAAPTRGAAAVLLGAIALLSCFLLRCIPFCLTRCLARWLRTPSVRPRLRQARP